MPLALSGRATALGLLIPVLLVIACRSETPRQDYAAHDVVERSVDPGTRMLVFQIPAGSVTVVGTEDPQASLRFERHVRANSGTPATERLRQFRIEESEDPRQYHYTVRMDREEGVEVHLTAFVPEHTPLLVALGTGSIRLSGIAGNVTARTENGTIDAAGLAGREVHLRTDNGTIDAGLAVAPGAASHRYEARNGNITVDIPRDASVRLEAETQTGTVTADGLAPDDERLDRTWTGMRFSGRLGDGLATVVARTQVGNVLLREGHRTRLDDEPATAARTMLPPAAPTPPYPEGGLEAPTPLQRDQHGQP
jgi:hypothetical protein